MGLKMGVRSEISHLRVPQLTQSNYHGHLATRVHRAARSHQPTEIVMHTSNLPWTGKKPANSNSAIPRHRHGTGLLEKLSRLTAARLDVQHDCRLTAVSLISSTYNIRRSAGLCGTFVRIHFLHGQTAWIKLLCR